MLERSIFDSGGINILLSSVDKKIPSFTVISLLMPDLDRYESRLALKTQEHSRDRVVLAIRSCWSLSFRDRASVTVKRSYQRGVHQRKKDLEWPWSMYMQHAHPAHVELTRRTES